MQVTPALPWSPGSGGTIQLETPITFNELLAGKLTFLYAGDGSGEIDIVEYDGGAVLKISNAVFYGINSWEGRASTIQVLWARGDFDPSMPYLSAVLVNPNLVTVGITTIGQNNYLTCTDENGDTVFLTENNNRNGIVAQISEDDEITIGFTPNIVPFGPAQEYPPENYNPIVFENELLDNPDVKKAKIKKIITNWRYTEGDEDAGYNIQVQARNLVINGSYELAAGDESPFITSWHAS